MLTRIRRASALGIVAAVTLMLELVLMRAFDAMVNSEMSHLILTCALFSFGLSGVYASLRPAPAAVDPGERLAKLAVWFGVFSLLLLPLLNLNPFNYSALQDDLASQIVYFAVMYLTLMAPFCLSGLIFTTIFSSYPAQIRTLYCFDLCGAAIGCVAFIPFIPRLGPGGLLFVAAGLCFIAAVLFSGKLARTQAVWLAAALAVIAVPVLRTDGYFDFAEHENKRSVMQAKQAGMLETTRWDPVAKIEIIREKSETEHGKRGKARSKREGYKNVAYDGGEQTSRFYAFDGDYAKLRHELAHDSGLFNHHFWNRGVVASHWLRADSNADVLIIGSAGGQETKAALLYNAKSVTTVEMVKAVVDLATHEYSDFIGNIFKDPRVHPHVGEGRTYLRSNDQKYDIIQIFSNHTSSSMAAGGGAGRGVYLQTVEAYEEYFSSLKPDGILQINHHFYPRMITTAAAAWHKLGRTDFRKHVLVFERRRVDPTPLMLIKMTPWTEAEVATLSSFMLKRPKGQRRSLFALREDPLNPRASFLSDEFYSGSLSPALVKRVPYRITPPTDDRPYFNFLRKKIRVEQVDPSRFVNKSAAGTLNMQLSPAGQGRGLVVPLDIAHYVVSAVVGLFFAAILVLVPLYWGTFSSRAPKRAPWPGAGASLFYFSCLGAGFILIELTFVQIFMKLIGVPLYTYSAVIFTMLAAAGLGSNAARALRVSPTERWWLPYVGTIGSGLLMLLLYPSVFDQFLSASLTWRLIVGCALIVPTSFFLGMCLPLGILAIADKPKGAIPWAWGMNGLFTTIGGLAAALLSMFMGFRVTLVIAFGIYALAALAFARMKTLFEAAAAGSPTPAPVEPLTAAAAGPSVV